MTWWAWVKRWAFDLPGWDRWPCGCVYEREALYRPMAPPRLCPVHEAEWREWYRSLPKVCRRCGVATPRPDMLCRECDDSSGLACLAACC